MPTYKAIQGEVRAKNGFTPKTCWIAHAFELSGRRLRHSWNRSDHGVRKYLCPPEKLQAVLDAIGEISNAPRRRSN
jgi:hypothetical protein